MGERGWVRKKMKDKEHEWEDRGGDEGRGCWAMLEKTACWVLVCFLKSQRERDSWQIEKTKVTERQ